MTSSTPKPRAGEPMKAGALHELIADYRHLAWPEEDQTVEAMRLDLIERALREHSSKMKALEAECDLLRERERELVEALRALTQVGTIDGNVVVGPRGWEMAQALLAKHGRCKPGEHCDRETCSCYPHGR